MTRQVFSVVGLGFGDEGKGTTVDYLARKHDAGLVVRFNGGAQAAHNVVEPGGRHHTFSQFGSGTFAGAPTHLGQHVVVNPATMLREAQILSDKDVADPLSSVTVDRRALATTRFHMAANRLRELARGDGRHGSCGMGVGETVALAERLGEATLRVGDLSDPTRLPRLLRIQQDLLRESIEHLTPSIEALESGGWHAIGSLGVLESRDSVSEVYEQLRSWSKRVAVVGEAWLPEWLRGTDRTVIFEGAQGVLLDQSLGFFPHVTRADTTLWHADEVLGDFDGPITRLGVTRTYLTRHGAGPMPTEDPALQHLLTDDHNEGATGEWQGRIRAGALDLELLDCAAENASVEGLDGLVVTHCDKADVDALRVSGTYDIGSDWLDNRYSRGAKDHEVRTEIATRARPVYVEMSLDQVAERVDLPIVLRSHGQTHLDKTEA